MLILLPPSETKREGGTEGTRLTLRDLGFPQLGAARRTALAALEELSRDPVAAAAALKLGPTQAHETERARDFSDQRQTFGEPLGSLPSKRAPTNGIVKIAGPDRDSLSGLAQRFMSRIEDPREVIADVHAPYFGAELATDTLVPAHAAWKGSLDFEHWLACSEFAAGYDQLHKLH